MNDFLALVYSLIVKTHIAAGVVALLSFWTAGLARKARGGVHVRAGSIYLAAMRTILVTGLPMALSQFVEGRPAQGVFLSYLLVLVATTVYIAPRAIRYKQDFRLFRSGGYRALAIALPIAAAASMSYGLIVGSALLSGFSTVGLTISYGMWRNLRRSGPEAGWWLKEHYGAMIGNGIGTHISFLSIGLSRLLPIEVAETAQMVAWFGPLFVAVIATVLLNRQHRRRFGGRPMPVAAAAVGFAPTTRI